MTHRERVLAALSHREPDRVPLDLGATRNSSVVVDAYQRLVEWLGLADALEVDIPRHLGAARGLRLAQVDEQILRRLDVDMRPVFLGPPDNWQDTDLDEHTYQDQWGVVRRRPPTSYYYDIVRSPLSGDITISDILRLSWPDPEDPGLVRGLREQAQKLRETTDYAIVLHLGNIFIHQSQYIRGFEDWYIDFAANPALVCALMDTILEIRLVITRRALEEVGDLVDVVSVSDDVADQRGPVISPTMFRHYLKPRFARYFELVHSLTSARVLFHSCGSVYKLLPDFIDLGMDCINPVQVSAADMDTARLKREFGDRLVFWGGIDTRRVLPQGSVDDVRGEVRRRVRDLAPGGGYILCAVHNVQPDVPPENVWTMYEAALEMGRYPITLQNGRKTKRSTTQ
jgi:uroporphyrinogen decarboxylase